MQTSDFTATLDHCRGLESPRCGEAFRLAAAPAHQLSGLPERLQSPREELANSLTHAVALLGAIAAVPVLVVAAAQHGGAAGIVGASVFAASAVLVYFTSTVYHAFPLHRPAAKAAWRVVDHGAIFLLIAGTYTPFTLGVLRGPWGWTLFGLVWGLAAAGVALKVFGGARYPVVSTCLYLAAGWVVLVGLGPVWSAVPAWGLFWLLAGGLAYTGGVIFFAADRIRYFHLAWHLCVMAGTACHFIAVLRYAA